MTNGPHRWRKSSRSGTGGNCVELAASLDLVRDSKSPGDAVLRVDVVALLGAVKSGRFER